MQKDSEGKTYQWTSISMNLANIAIIIILTASIVYERFSAKIAVVASLLIWVVFGGVLMEIIQQWQKRRKLVDDGIPLHHICIDCGLRFSIMKTQCPRCDKIVKD